MKVGFHCIFDVLIGNCVQSYQSSLVGTVERSIAANNGTRSPRSLYFSPTRFAGCVSEAIIQGEVGTVLNEKTF